MRLIYRAVLSVACLAVASGAIAYCQDSPSLGDVARQAHQQKQEKDSQINKDGNTANAPKVITEEQISSHQETMTSDSSPTDNSKSPATAASTGGPKQSAETWKSQIQAQKDAIGTLQAQISKLNDSIQFAPANCVSGCVQWNERQQQKQQEVERMRSQLDTLNQHLQEMQEAARQQGYGSSVYDPN